MKSCNKCLEDKPYSEFGVERHAKDGYRNTCKACRNAQLKIWREENRSRVQEQARRSGRKLWATKGKDRMLKYKYGITLVDYNQMVLDQEAKCKICGTIPRMLVVDHDHATGKIRGLLCDDCNLAIGKFKDNVESLKSAIRYLEG